MPHKDPETAKAYFRARYKASKDRIAATKKAWYEANKDRIAPRYEANKDRIAAAGRAWRKANKGKAVSYVVKRNARKLQATPAWANEAAIRELYAEAAFLTAVIGEPYHVDHIVPLQSKLVCGLHWEANLRVIQGDENISKGNRHWPDMP